MPEPQDKQDAEPLPAFEIIEPKHGVYHFYANRVDALWTPHDVKIKFFELMRITKIPDSPRLNVYEERAGATLAWTEAKILALMLTGLIEDYEKLNGEIKIGKIP